MFEVWWDLYSLIIFLLQIYSRVPLKEFWKSVNNWQSYRQE